jgi:hypothetical protein
MKLSVSWGMLCLSVYLIFVGLSLLFGFSFNNKGVVEGVLALAGGILILIGK